ncbi:MAG: GDSL-type esterase/lipase family protein [Oscillospiraceae bacterium]
MNIYKSLKVFLTALSLITLTSCNFIENLAIENIPESTITTIEDITTTDIQTTDITTQIPEEQVTNNYIEITIPSYNESYVTTTTPDYPINMDTYTTNDITTIPVTENTPNTSIDTSYFEKYCAFIGDSLSVGLSAYGFIPENHTFAKEGISLRGINSLQLQTDNGYLYPAQAVASWKLKEVYILLGINGVSWIDNNEAISEYATLINSIKQYNPSIQINVISVLPVAYSTETIDTVANGRILNSEIDTFNTMLRSMSTQLGCHYIDANSSMKNQNGYLPDDITFDGLHLTKSGYEKLVDILLQDVQLRN